MKRNLLLLCVATLVSDVLVAQLAKTFWDLWDVRKFEAAYRVRSAAYHHDLATNVAAIGIWGRRRYPIWTNSLGFRDREIRDVPLRSGRPRVLLLGDSFTEGVGVRYEDTFAGVVAEEFERREIEVLNAAVVSYSPSIYYRKTKHLLEDRDLTFHELVVFVDISDIHDEAAFYTFDADDNVIAAHKQPADWISHARDGSTMHGAIPFLKNNSVIFRSLHRGFVGETVLAMECWSTGLHRSMWTVEEKTFQEYGREGVRRALANMHRLSRLLSEREIRLTIAVYPWPDQVLHRDRDSRQVRIWREWAHNSGVGFLDFFPEFVNGEDPQAVIDRYFIPCDMHLNEAGHRLMAQAFLRRYVPNPRARQ
jgi:lysophospholipase L1-like esterase